MKVLKFGGASIKDANRIRNVAEIIREYADSDRIIVVVSAIDKTTNFLETLLSAYLNNSLQINSIFEKIKNFHFNIISELFEDKNDAEFIEAIEIIFSKLQQRISAPPTESYDFEYDQIVSFGEIISSTILSYYLLKQQIDNQWINAKDLILTDSLHREANVDWEKTGDAIQQSFKNIWENNTNKIVLTQGFIGGTEGVYTTLGREGSDFSAAIFAYSMNAESVTIWKDVEGFLNADPKLFSDAVRLEKIPYREATELAYYGANIIHPKTLKPLQNKNIPLHVKSFLQPRKAGSIIHDFKIKQMTPCFIKKENQVLMSISPKDFSFIAEENLSTIFALFAFFGVKINLIQNSAISFSVCVDNRNTIPELIEELQTEFFVKYNENVELLTIRHYTGDSLEKWIKNKKIILEQRNRLTLQVVLK